MKELTKANVTFLELFNLAHPGLLAPGWEENETYVVSTGGVKMPMDLQDAYDKLPEGK